jgi:hypothetical protein
MKRSSWLFVAANVASASEVLLVMDRICEREEQRRKRSMDRRHADPLLTLARRQLDELKAGQRARGCRPAIPAQLQSDDPNNGNMIDASWWRT